MKSYTKPLPRAGDHRDDLEVTTREPTASGTPRGDKEGNGQTLPKRASAETELPLLVSIERAAKELGIGRSLVYELLGGNQLASVKIGRRRFIRRDDLVHFVRDLPAQ